MAIVREGNKAVLLVVDVQTGVVRNAWETERIIRNINIVVKKARDQRVPVIWVQHEDRDLVHGSASWQLAQGLEPAAGETRIYKRHNSSFEKTELEDTLRQLGIAHLFLAGASTDWCIRATAYAALERGYDLTLIKDAHTTEDIVKEDGTKIKAEDIILDLNTVMDGLSYPDRQNRAVTAADVDFAD